MAAGFLAVAVVAGLLVPGRVATSRSGERRVTAAPEVG
jgi:hypothetical protein